MNQHSIPTELHRRLGLDNIEPSGLEGDRPVADVASEAQATGIDPSGQAFISVCNKADDLVGLLTVLHQNLENNDATFRQSQVARMALKLADSVSEALTEANIRGRMA
ncbi:hypothetical protein ASD50_17125 [Mesorhizobium sp. Root552]|uniref:hypothetical protein n=1 Tax=Mesorhizobium sp. Root552 TaxID=1736555 RepID=UPI0006FA027E|nr:hypothetical protein [Mesorhizobium sp. Root552]KQZ30739.1 hypothetical protein ASD50_17125 [Mesorhizobium sp. Root552]